jgi:hypothetical protein
MIIRKTLILLPLLAGTLLSACGPGDSAAPRHISSTASQAGPVPEFKIAGKLESARLNEASGIQAVPGNRFIVHNDEGARLYLIDATGRDLGFREVVAAKNRDWEDITRVPGADGPLLVVGDFGDNRNVRNRVSLYFVREPSPSDTSTELQVQHRLRFTYPDGPRDVEAMAYDAAGGRLLLLSKRDQPPRLYGLPLDLALWRQEMQAEFLSEVPGFRPPTKRDILMNPGRGLWVSQPTGMDISPDGSLAAVLTYRSLYLFRREGTESWPEAFQRQPVEYVGPPGTHDEAVSFSLDGRSIYVTTEGRPAPLYRLDLP